ncbi:MAG: exosortase/archaeosortase family protein [Candidatus Aenigmatarchaeota archaeon]
MNEDYTEDIKRLLRFFLKFSILSGVIYFVSTTFNFYALQELTAEWIYDFARVTGANVEIQGIRLTIREADFLITEDCTAWKGIFFFGALLLSSGKSVTKVLKGLAVGIPSIYSLNLLRIITIILSALRFSQGNYEIIHGFLWRSTMILAVIALWVMWMNRTNFLTKETN